MRFALQLSVCQSCISLLVYRGSLHGVQQDSCDLSNREQLVLFVCIPPLSALLNNAATILTLRRKRAVAGFHDVVVKLSTASRRDGMKKEVQPLSSTTVNFTPNLISTYYQQYIRS